MFRYKPGIHAGYARQGYICFCSLRYREMSEKGRAAVRQLCREAGGEYHAALLKFVTTEAGADSVCAEFYLSRATLYRAVKKYYEQFPDWIF